MHRAKPHRGPGTSPGDMEPIIAGRDLRKSWGATLVLEHADFLLHAGDKVALVGPNGSGKSTLFRILAGETAPDLGDLVLKPGLRYGYLPQVPNVPPETAVRDVLSAPSPEAQRIEAELAGLEAWMARPEAWDAADVLLASHDKFLLDAIAEKVIELDRLRTLEYVGNYTVYRVQRDAIARAREAQRHRHQKELKRQLAIIEEFKSRKVYEQVLSRKLRLERMRRETPEAPPTAPRAFRLSFRKGASGPGVVRLEGVAKSHAGRLLFADVDLELAKGDKLGLVGPNGAGKTTLLEVLIGRQEADAGSVFRGKNLAIGYFAQEAEELDFSRTLLEEISSVRHPPPPESWARGLLGRFWFRGDAVHSRVGQLSGGERARLALAKFIAQDYDLLVLDEPTNHLDIESQEIVAAALQTYPGMLLVVSHNRSFLNEVANKIAVIAHQRLAVFQGTFKDSWAAAKMAEFMAVKQKPRYRVLRVVKDWETGTAYHGGDVIALQGAETQAFLRLLRWAEANGRVERIET